uniref:ABC transporter ATP-binding protein/permease n=1 Tax=Agathobacter sp. TaxID=2021311 RepID=UPI0040573D1D
MIKTRLIKLLNHVGKYVAYNILWQWFAMLSQVIAVFTIANMMQSIADDSISSTLLGQTGIILLSVICVRFFCEKKASEMSYKASVDVKRILRERIYEKMLRLGASYGEKTSTSEVVQVCAEGVEQLEIYFGKYLPQLFYSLLAPLTLFGILSFVNFKASIVLLICVPLIPISIVAVQKIAKRLLSKYWGKYTQLGDSFLENLQGLTTLKIYQADAQKAVEMDEEAQNFRRITMKVLIMQLNSTSVMDIVAYGGAAVGMIVVLSEYFAGTVSLAGTITIILLASEFFIPLRLLGSFFHIAMNGMAASDKMFALLDLEENKRGDVVLPKEEQPDIEIQNVRFSYEKEREILKGVSLKMPKGSFVSLVGASGCGKSTIAGLLSGKNHSYTGHVMLGGAEITDVTEESLMNTVTTIRHNSYLFKGTVEENLKAAKGDATKEEMEAVLKKVNLLGFLSAQDGLQTKLLERASNLSGGQCQRLALARALLHDAKVYIFDEATSNIDAESEEQIMEVIHELAKTKTVILISHRLSNVVDSDCIYMMKNGEIAESGTHDALMRKNGAYKNLFESQRVLENYGKAVG